MFNRNDVIASVRAHLAQEARAVESALVPGTDFVAAGKDGRFLVVVTGETTSKRTTRLGEAFRPRQVVNHVANAIYKALKLSEAKADSDIVALALPRNADHEDCVTPVAGTLARLGIRLLWVDAGGRVTGPGS